MSIGVLIADDQALQRMGFAMILEAEEDIHLVGDAGDGGEAVRRAAELGPDVILMDVRMPGMDGIEATRRVVEAGGHSRVIILTTFDLDEYVYAALRAGASGFLLKDALPADLVAAVRAVAAGDAIVAPRLTRRLLDSFAHRLPDPADGGADATPAPDPGLDTLTSREREILVAVAGGLSNAEIAERFTVSEATVKTHVGRILAKLDVRDRVQAVIAAYESGLVRPGQP